MVKDCATRLLAIMLLMWPLTMHAQDMAQSDAFPPPVFTTDAGGNVQIPGWERVDSIEGNRYRPLGAENNDAPGFFQLISENKDYNVISYFDFLCEKAGLTNVNKAEGTVIEAYYQVAGTMLAATFGEAEIEGNRVYVFMDLNGPDFENKIIGNLIYATPEVFNTWHGVLFPLLLNGYVEDPDIFTNKEVMAVTDFEQASAFYAAMINTKLYSDYSTMITLSEEAQRAMRNAAVIAGCAGTDNCAVRYDAEGNAIEEYTN